jgi:glycosyltransferase involved in cell wall biosynthesis
VHPTRYEGSSLVTLEAMAHRRAIVASRAGGLPDKIQDGVNGWLVEPGNDGELARAIGEALSTPARLSAMGKESRRILESRFAWTALADEHIALYDELRQRR